MRAAVLGTEAQAREHASPRVSLRVFQRTRFPAAHDCTMPASVSGHCGRIACRYHLRHRRTAEHRLQALRDCAIAVANEGAHTMEEIATILGVSREWVRQLEERALEKLRDNEAFRMVCDERLG